MNYNNNKEIDDTLIEIQHMCDSVAVLYKFYAKSKCAELEELGRFTYYLLWVNSIALIILKWFNNSSLRCEQDYALGQLCVIINESTKKIIGFSEPTRKKCFWNEVMGAYTIKHPNELKDFNNLGDSLRSFANLPEQKTLKELREITTHGDKKIEELLRLRSLPTKDIIRFLGLWGDCMLPAANFAFRCFEKECIYQSPEIF